jgi:hypothetical protein
MKIAFNACANCLHFEGDTETVRRFLNGRMREVYLHRCRKHPEREDAEHIAKGFDKTFGRTDGLIQGELF